MVMIAGLLSILAIATADPPADDASVRAALGQGRYPWYDTTNDTLKPVDPPKQVATPLLPNWLGSAFVILVMATALVIVLALLAWSILNANPGELTRAPVRRISGSASRVAALPPGLDLDVGDLWAEAKRRRELGDLSGAILCIFVHQLLSLEKRGLLRLAPGKTARQLVRSIGSSEIRGRVEPTLRLFEIAFYGHHVPDSLAFEAAWIDAEALERNLAGEARS